MVEDVYPANLAQLQNCVYAGQNGLEIQLSGLNDKLPRLLTVMNDGLSSLLSFL